MEARVSVLETKVQTLTDSFEKVSETVGKHDIACETHVPMAAEASKEVSNMSKTIQRIDMTLGALLSRNAKVDARDEKFLEDFEDLKKDISLMKAWIMVFKIFGGVILTTLIPFLAWVALSILDEKVKQASHDIPAATTNNQKVKVKTEKRRDK